MTGAEPTTAVPTRASIDTSPIAVLAFPNRPAQKNGTEAPLTGTVNDNVVENAPVTPARKLTAPPPGNETEESFTTTEEEVAPEGLLTRTRQGEGAHVRKRSLGLGELLMCSSTFTG
ncbi:MAG: hypothetical protein ACK528_00410 [Alphaproteobacteria bacterium]|jgi:hypothetical protein